MDKKEKNINHFIPVKKTKTYLNNKENIFYYLDKIPHFKILLLILTAIISGIILTPHWIIRTYPTNPDLIGKPAATDIKAQMDDYNDIIDTQTTKRLKDEAVNNILKIYDFDVNITQNLLNKLSSIFHTTHQNIQNITSKKANKKGTTIDMLSKKAEETDLINIEHISAIKKLKDELGISIPKDKSLLLKSMEYNPNFVSFLIQIIKFLHKNPVISKHEFSEMDIENGIIIRKTPTNKNQAVKTEKVSAIYDINMLKKKLDALLKDFLQETNTWRLNNSYNIELNISGIKGITKEKIIKLANFLITEILHPNLTLNHNDTELAKNKSVLSIAPVKISIKRGEMIIREGEKFTQRHIQILTKMASYSQRKTTIMVSIGATLLILILSMIILSIDYLDSRKNLLNTRDAVFISTIFIGILLLERFWFSLTEILHGAFPSIPQIAFVFLLPVASATMIARLVLKFEFALFFAFISSLILGFFSTNILLLPLFALSGSLVAIKLLGTISSRFDILKTGLLIGISQAITALSIQLFLTKDNPKDYVMIIIASFISGLLSSFITLAITPLIEAIFGYTTDLKLLELANLNHPALKELIVQAPGTYHHSIIVGALVETAAESIRANPLLARVMAYYHDLGKGCNAIYFIENQKGINNPHDKLKPSMSAMIIKRHVTDGLEIAKNYGLGEHILAGIAEHHGTTLIQYFYHKAKENADENNTIDEKHYRYPGSKPQSREAALVMLGDSVEASSRALTNPNPDNLRALVNRIINQKFTDGQLEECDLTLRDLHDIAKAFIKIITSIYHQRVKYPDPTQEPYDNNNNKENLEKPFQDNKSKKSYSNSIKRLGL